MPLAAVMGAQMQCSFGTAPSVLAVVPGKVYEGGPAAATIMDYTPIANIPPFGMCTSPSNPAVIAATAAASGVFTPAPCVPACPAPWVAGSPTVLSENMPALHQPSKLTCAWTGLISITVPGQAKVQVK